MNFIERFTQYQRDERHNTVAETRYWLDQYKNLCTELVAVPQPVEARCPYCDDTGDVHTSTGEWRGTCSCPAALPVPAVQPVMAGTVQEPVATLEISEWEVFGGAEHFNLLKQLPNGKYNLFAAPVAPVTERHILDAALIIQKETGYASPNAMKMAKHILTGIAPTQQPAQGRGKLAMNCCAMR